MLHPPVWPDRVATSAVRFHQRRAAFSNQCPGKIGSLRSPTYRLWVACLLPTAMMLHCLPGRFVVVGWVEFGAVAAPGILLDNAVDFAQLVRRHAQCHHLADAHHHIPRHYFDALRREFVV